MSTCNTRIRGNRKQIAHEYYLTPLILTSPTALNAIADAIVNNLGFSNVVVDDTVPDMATIGAQELGGVGGFKYYKTPVGQEPLIPWDTAPAAIVTESNTVQWSLGTGTLEDGVKYKLEFEFGRARKVMTFRRSNNDENN